jgi:hypothetical protein
VLDVVESETHIGTPIWFNVKFRFSSNAVKFTKIRTPAKGPTS